MCGVADTQLGNADLKLLWPTIRTCTALRSLNLSSNHFKEGAADIICRGGKMESLAYFVLDSTSPVDHASLQLRAPQRANGRCDVWI